MSSELRKAAVLGETDFVMPFAALGLDAFTTGAEPEQITGQAEAVVAGGYGLVVVAENVAPAVEQVFSEYENKPTPCVIIVPFTTEPTGLAVRSLGNAIKMAAGVDILKTS